MPVLAVDIPSGINADNGQVCGTCIQAAATATFGFAKVGHLSYPGRSLTGRLKVIEIGIPPHVAGASTAALAEVALGPVMTMTSTYDHRVIQGAESGLMLRRVDQLL